MDHTWYVIEWELTGHGPQAIVYTCLVGNWPEVRLVIDSGVLPVLYSLLVLFLLLHCLIFVNKVVKTIYVTIKST